MPKISRSRGSKAKYTGKQDRKADHIGGSGRGKKESHASARKGGRIGGRAAASRPKAARSVSARKAAATRKRRAA